MDYMETADPKSPAATLFHQLDVRPWLPAGLTLAAAVGVSVSPAGGLLVDQATSADGQFITYRVRGGVAEQDYIVTFFFGTTDGAWADEWSIRYPVR
jgi:hypothetical protein